MGTSRAATKWVVAAVLIAGVATIEILRRSGGPLIHEASGTVIFVDPAARTAKVEMIDPANGATRQFEGVIPESCVITLNGNPAAFGDLRVGDVIQARVRVERRGARSDRDRRTKTIAEAIEIKRNESGTRP